MREKNNYDFGVYNVVMHEWCRLASINSNYYVYLIIYIYVYIYVHICFGLR